MITPREALDLPTARLSPSDAAVAAELVHEMEDDLRKNMQRQGHSYAIPPERIQRYNPTIIAEALRVFRAAGWHTEHQLVVETNRFTHRQEQKLVIMLVPKDEHYLQKASADAEAANGTSKTVSA